MRKVVVLGVLAVLGAVVARRLRSRAASGPSQPVAQPATRPSPQDAATSNARSSAAEAVDPPVTAPPPPTSNGERVVLMSIWTLQERGQDASHSAVVRHVAAGEIDPDEGTVDVLLHQLVRNGCLARSSDDGPYHLTALGQAALQDGSSARPSPAGAAADELSSPTTTA